MHRVQKILSNFGFCSRRQAEVLIEKGYVSVNDEVITIGDKADPKKDVIKVKGEVITESRKVYLMLNKPKGYVSTLSDPQQRKTIVELVKIKERVFPIGRLDINTEGLILLTNDGDFANLIMHPRYNIKKKYVVKIREPIKREDVENLKNGVNLLDGKTSPAKVKVLNKDRTLIEIVIHEGKNRILRRMFNELGYYVMELKRVKIEFLELRNLSKGRWRELKPNEVARMTRMAKSNMIQ